MRGILLAAALLAAPAGAQQTTLQPGETLLEVEAEGRAVVRPDTAFVTAGVVTTGANASEATAANARAMSAVIAAVRRAGVEERHVRTRQISVEPQFAPPSPGSYQRDESKIVGYLARNGVAITIVRLGIASQVIDAAFGAGANSVNGPNLGLFDDARAVAAARRDAIANAKAQAQTYADGLGLRIARVIRISERGRSAVPQMFVTAAPMSADVAPPPPAPPPPPVAIGEIRQTATVWIDFALVPNR